MNQITGRTIVVVVALLLISGIVYAANPSSVIGDFFTPGNITAKAIGGVIYADQYATIQDALNVSRDNNGAHIYVSKGIYIQNKFALEIFNNTNLECEDRNTTVIKVGDNIYNAADATNRRYGMLVPSSSYDGDPPTHLTHNIKISNCGFDVNKRGNPTMNQANYGYGLYFLWANGVDLENNWVNDSYESGIGIWQPNDGSWLGQELYMSGNLVTHAGNAQTLTSGFFLSDGTGHPNKATLIGNIARDNAGNGIGIEDSSGGISLIGNHANNNVGAGIFLQMTKYVTGVGNTLEYNMDGLYFVGAGEYWNTFSGNTMRNNSRYGVYAAGHQTIYTGNIIKYNGQSGIYLNAYQNIINSNQIFDNGGNISAPYRDGISVFQNYNDNIITNNIIGCDSVYCTAINRTTQLYGINETQAITGYLNQYLYNNLRYNNISGLRLNSGSTGSVSIGFNLTNNWLEIQNNTGNYKMAQTQNVYSELFIGNGGAKNFSTTYLILGGSSSVYVNGTKQTVGASYDYQEFTQSVNLTSAPVNNARIEVDYAQG